MPVIHTSLNLSLWKESSEKKTSKKNELKVNSNSFLNYNLNNHIKNFARLRVFGLSASAIMAAIMTLAAFPIITHLNIAEAAPGTSKTSDTTISMTTDYENVNLSLSIAGTGEAFAESSSSEQARFTILTNNYTGYTLTIAGKNDSRELVDSTTGAALSSIESVVDRYTFDDSTYNGKWGFKPSKYNSTNNVGFWPGPTTTPTTLDVTTVANTSIANEYTIGLGARVGSTTPAGTYSGTFTLSTTANPVTYTVNFADNTGDTSVSNIPSYPLTGSTTSANLVLPSTVPTRTGYTFKAWCMGELGADASTIVTNNGTTCNGTSFNPGDNFGIDQTTENVVTLYATWNNNNYGITIRTVTGVESVSLNGTECTSTSGCTVDSLVGGETYVLTATLAQGYSFNGWNKTNASATIANTSKAITTYKVDGSADTITPAVSLNKYTVTIKTVTGISKVTLNGTSCASTSGCNVNNLEYGKSYTLTAEKSSGYDFVAWSANGAGTIANINSISTTYVVGPGSSIIVPGVSSCIQTMEGYMQYAPAPSAYCSDASGSMTDSRDDQIYTVFKYGNLLWMSRNLAIGCNGTGSSYGSGRTTRSLTSSNSNVSSTWSTSSALSLGKTDNTTNCTTSNTTDCNSYTTARMKCDSTYGAWYNYAATTAGTITGSTNSTEAQYSVCPKGWRLFTSSEHQTSTDFESPFNPVRGGFYYDGVVNDASVISFWWSSTVSDGYRRSTLSYFLSADRYGRDRGLYVRCVKSI